MAEEASMTRRKRKLLGWSEEGALKRNRAYSLLRMGPWVSLSSPVPRKVTGRGDLEARSSHHWRCALEEAVGTSPILSRACWPRVSALLFYTPDSGVLSHYRSPSSVVNPSWGGTPKVWAKVSPSSFVSWLFQVFATVIES